MEKTEDKVIIGWGDILERASETSGMSKDALEESYDTIYQAGIDLFNEVKVDAFKANKSVVLEMKNTMISCFEVDEHLEKDINGDSIKIEKSVGVRTGISEQIWISLNDSITLDEIVTKADNITELKVSEPSKDKETKTA